MWIRPLQCVVNDNIVTLYAPNRFVLDWVRDKYVNRINELITLNEEEDSYLLKFDVGSKPMGQSITTKPSNAFTTTNNRYIQITILLLFCSLLKRS